MTINLEEGNPELADASPAERRKAARQIASEGAARRKATVTSRSTSGRISAAQKIENELSDRLDRTFDRIARSLEARGDAELATAIDEDKSAMGQGLVSLTRNVTPLRSPLLILLNCVEPILAFGRVTRLLYVRWIERRARVEQERQEQAAMEAEQSVASNGMQPTEVTMWEADAGT